MEIQWKAEKQAVVEKKQANGIQSTMDEEISKMQEKYIVQVAERKVAQDLLNKALMEFEKAEGQMKAQYVTVIEKVYCTNDCSDSVKMSKEFMQKSKELPS